MKWTARLDGPCAGNEWVSAWLVVVLCAGRAIMSDFRGEKALIMVHPWSTSRDAVCNKTSSAMRVLWWIRILMTQTAPAALPKLR